MEGLFAILGWQAAIAFRFAGDLTFTYYDRRKLDKARAEKETTA
jgi:hypothetical protein